jgi:hypothetical protein
LDQIISGGKTASDLQGANIDLGDSTAGAGGLETRYLPNGQGYYVDDNGDYAGLVPDETESAVDLTEIDDGGGTDFSVVPGDARDDVYFDLSDPAERLVTENGVGFTGTYGGVTYTDGYEVKEPLQVEITPGGDIGASIDDALGAGTTTSAGGANTATEALLDLTADMASGDVDVDEATATLNLITGKDLTADDVAALMPPGTSANTSTQIDSAVNTAVENTGLSVQQIASGLGYETVAGFLEELSLRIEGTAKMAEDVIGDMGVYDLAGQQFEMQGGDFAPGSESNLYAAIQSAVAQEELNKDVKDVGDSDFVQGLITTLNNADEDNPGLAQDLLEKRDPEYVAKVALQMPNPDNEGYNMAGEPITPGLWMASVAAQELIGLGLDVGTVLLLGPVAGGAVAFQQGTAEAGAAAANETKAELESLRASGALDHLSEEEFNTVVDTAETQAFYTSGLAGGAVDTLVALTAGGFAPLAKALPTAINSAITGLGVLGAEGVSGGLEQVGVNAAVIKALEDQGINPADYDKGYLDQVITAAIYETVGGTGAGAASTVGSAVQNLSAKSDGEAQSGYDDLGGALTTAGSGTDFDASSEITPFTQTNTQSVNTINTQTVTDAEGQTYTVDTAVDANGNTSVTVTNDATSDSTTTDVGTGTLNSVNVGAGTSIILRAEVA